MNTPTPWLGLATLFLAILKLTGHIAISWWWVFSPLLIAVALAIVFTLLAGVIIWLSSK